MLSSPLIYHILCFIDRCLIVGLPDEPVDHFMTSDLPDFFLVLSSADLFLTTEGPKFETWISKVIKPALVSVQDQLCTLVRPWPIFRSGYTSILSHSPQNDDAMQIELGKPLRILFVNKGCITYRLFISLCACWFKTSFKNLDPLETQRESCQKIRIWVLPAFEFCILR